MAIPILDGYPLALIINGVKFTVIKTNDCPDLTIIGLYHSPQIAISHILHALHIIHDENSSSQNLVIGDFNVNLKVESERQTLYNLMVVESNYRQIFGFTTDNGTLIDHQYTDLIEEDIHAGTLEQGVSQGFKIDCPKRFCWHGAIFLWA